MNPDKRGPKKGVLLPEEIAFETYTELLGRLKGEAAYLCDKATSCGQHFMG